MIGGSPGEVWSGANMACAKHGGSLLRRPSGAVTKVVNEVRRKRCLIYFSFTSVTMV